MEGGRDKIYYEMRWGGSFGGREFPLKVVSQPEDSIPGTWVSTDDFVSG